MPAHQKKALRAKPPRSLRVGIVEDNAATRRIVRGILEKQSHITCIGAWSNAEEALAASPALQPDVMLVDLELPGMSGEDCLRALSSILPETALIVLSAYNEPARVFAALIAGAKGYIVKNMPPEELVSAITAAHRGGAPLTPAVAALVVSAFLAKRREPRSGLPLPSLSRRERQILDLLAAGKAPKETATELAISYSTVRDYLKQIYRKLHVRSRTEAVLRYLAAGADHEDNAGA